MVLIFEKEINYKNCCCHFTAADADAAAGTAAPADVVAPATAAISCSLY